MFKKNILVILATIFLKIANNDKSINYCLILILNDFLKICSLFELLMSKLHCKWKLFQVYFKVHFKHD